MHWSKLLGREVSTFYILLYFPQNLPKWQPNLYPGRNALLGQADLEGERRGLSSLPSEETTWTTSATGNSHHRELAVPTERGPGTGLVPHKEMSTDLMGPQWAKLLATQKVRVEKKILLRHQESLPS